ncbi:PREDICTED: uncharacterized protein LOC109125910 [Camelina sativa]|uniref:Uncharacterized protein LOC109125910 n=1 Tax=Camelina sativa TaxID=90675 RepID=A0ABM1QBW3_CAMSA|nr:PREDICTED: uncharacterized protein LOC109125910 [Camelina sativa]
MKLPEGYAERKGITLPKNVVCKLLKLIYGLKQASRQWYKRFSSLLLSLGFTKGHGDQTLFVKPVGRDDFVAVLVYVDDIVIASTTDIKATKLTAALKQLFKLRDLGCKPSSLPMIPNLKMYKEQGDLLEDRKQYRRIVGKLMYLTITRPDITFAVNKLCQYISAPHTPHLAAAYHVLGYIKGTVGQGLFYSANADLTLKGFADSNYGGCLDSRRSTTGFTMFVGDSLISWRSKKQHTVSRSSAEVEYRALALASCELVWLSVLLRDLRVNTAVVPISFSDSTAAVYIATNPVFYERTKHIEIDCHTGRDCLDVGLLKLLHVNTEDQVVDILTKPLFSPQFEHLKSKMSIQNIFQCT